LCPREAYKETNPPISKVKQFKTKKNTDLSENSYYIGAGKVSDGIIEKIKGYMAQLVRITVV
jgi:hypothetical protein